MAILAVMLVNLRGLRESGTVFAIPTYVFVVATLGLIAVGISRALIGDAPHVTGVVTASVPLKSLSVLLVMRAFADGCSAITGVEAVSNGVPAFKRPEAANARLTLTMMGAGGGLPGILDPPPVRGELRCTRTTTVMLRRSARPPSAAAPCTTCSSSPRPGS